MSTAVNHSHDVEIVWNIWPLNVMLWEPVSAFLQGHGLNWINNIAMDFLWFPILVWNIFMSSIFSWFDTIWYFLNWLPNLVFGVISELIFWLPDTIYVIWKALPFLVIGGVFAGIGVAIQLALTAASAATTSTSK